MTRRDELAAVRERDRIRTTPTYRGGRLPQVAADRRFLLTLVDELAAALAEWHTAMKGTVEGCATCELVADVTPPDLTR